MKNLKLLILISATLFSFGLYSQRGGGGHQKSGGGGHGQHQNQGGHNRGQHVNNGGRRHSNYRPARIVVYHPHWHANYSYHRRWVYFPRYNMYWDNWRNHYVFWNGSIWLSQPTAPAIIVNVNLQDEKKNELREDDDDDDDIYKSNDSHKSNYKPE